MASLDPPMTIGQSIAEPLRIHRSEMGRTARRDAVAAMMARLGFGPAMLNGFPHALSGGQNQRVGSTRATAWS